MPQLWHRHAAMGTYTLLYIGSGSVWSGVAERAKERAKGELKNQNAIGGVAGDISYLRGEK